MGINMKEILRAEYPRPQFERKDWMSLNGIWDFSFEQEGFDQKICVPFVYESKLSGIDRKDFHEAVWYRRYFKLPEEWKQKSIILHFGAVDYECKVWVNRQLAAHHIGGQTGFSVDISEYLIDGENELKVCVHDFHQELDIPRGKQYWKEDSQSIFYTATMGIWQSVWLEPVSKNHIRQIFITPLFDEKSVKFEYELVNFLGVELETKISFGGILANKTSIFLQSRKGSFVVALEEAVLGCWNVVEDLAWTPEQPRLFDVEFTLKREKDILDSVRSYFGMRKVSIENGKFLLNNRPYFQRLILDQGYWPDGLLTAPSDDAFIDDIILAKKMGFNGARKHQKVEDPRYLYHADRLGFLVWGEIGSGYTYSRRLASDMMKEWMDAITRDYNHPCIVVWTPLNESWGVLEISKSLEQQNFCRALYAITKAIDTTRPISDNDGWEHVESDLLTIHDYESDMQVFGKRYCELDKLLEDRPAGRALYVDGADYHKKPIIVSEFGGISFLKESRKGWGYSNAATKEEFIKKYHEVITALLHSENIQGFCYTQLTDVEQEVNGLLNYDRTPKVNLEDIRKITCSGRD